MAALERQPPPTADAAAADLSPTTSFESLSRARYISAPMVNQSDVAWRMLLRRHGAQVVYTQMLESDRFVRDEQYRREMFVTCAADRPLIVQFSANDPQLLAAAAKLVEPHCDAVCLNLGCPQRAARSGGYGAYLLEPEHFPLIMAMLRAVKDAGVLVPLCAKIRLLPSLPDTIQLCKQLTPHADVITIHGRTRGFVEERRKGPADLLQIKAIVSTLRADQRSIRAAASSSPDESHLTSRPLRARPVVLWTNGNVRCDDDVDANIASTATDGCMVGEALLNDPTLFDRCQLSTQKNATGSSNRSPGLAGYSPDSLLSLVELDRKIAIVDEYIDALQHPAHHYFSPFAASPSNLSSAASPAVSGSASIAGPSLVTDDVFQTPLASWTVFHGHLYHILNSDMRARFLHHTQLVDEFLDAESIGGIRGVLRTVRERVSSARPFDVSLQATIDVQRSHRQQERAANQRKRRSAAVVQAGGVKQLNSRERKRARWQQRKQEEKRRKLEDGSQEIVSQSNEVGDPCT